MKKIISIALLTFGAISVGASLAESPVKNFAHKSVDKIAEYDATMSQTERDLKIALGVE